VDNRDGSAGPAFFVDIANAVIIKWFLTM